MLRSVLEMVVISERRLAKGFVAFTLLCMGAMLVYVTTELLNAEISIEQIEDAVEFMDNALASPDHVIITLKTSSSFSKKSTLNSSQVQYTDNLKNLPVVWEYAETSELQDSASAPKSLITPELSDTQHDSPDQSKSVTPPSERIRPPLNRQDEPQDQTNTTIINSRIAQPVKNHKYTSKENFLVSNSNLPRGNGGVVNSNIQANTNPLQLCQKPRENLSKCLLIYVVFPCTKLN